jgi:hypothetical protein
MFSSLLTAASLISTCYIMRNFGTYFTGTYVYLLVLHESLLHESAIFHLSIKIHGFRDPTGIVKYGHIS